MFICNILRMLNVQFSYHDYNAIESLQKIFFRMFKYKITS